MSGLEVDEQYLNSLEESELDAYIRSSELGYAWGRLVRSGIEKDNMAKEAHELYRHASQQERIASLAFIDEKLACLTTED